MPYREQDITLDSVLPAKLLDEPPPPDAKTEDLYDRWGFTIYRTAYGGETNIYWEALLQTLHTNVLVAITQYHEDEPDEREANAVELLLELLRLDNRSDPALDGKSLDELRDAYHREPFGWLKRQPGAIEGPPNPSVFLVADADVLKSVEAGTYVFKCVDMDFFQRSHVQSPRVPQDYYGWMLMSPIAVLPLWQRLWRSDVLENIAPPVRFGQPMKVWTHFSQWSD